MKGHFVPVFWHRERQGFWKFSESKIKAKVVTSCVRGCGWIPKSGRAESLSFTWLLLLRIIFHKESQGCGQSSSKFLPSPKSLHAPLSEPSGVSSGSWNWSLCGRFLSSLSLWSLATTSSIQPVPCVDTNLRKHYLSSVLNNSSHRSLVWDPRC